MRDEGAARPCHRRAEHDEQADCRRSAFEPARRHDEPEADEADDGCHPRRARDSLGGERSPDDDLERDRAGDQRRDRRVDPRLGNVHHADAEPEQRHAEPRGGERLARRDAERAAGDRQHRREDRGRREKPRAGGEERWQRAHGELDAEIGGAPDQIDDPEGDPEPDMRSPHANENARAGVGVRSRGDTRSRIAQYNDRRSTNDPRGRFDKDS